MRCAPQQIPGEVCEKARRQSFLKQQSLQPCEARLRWLDAATAVVGSAATTASMRSWMIAFIAKLLQIESNPKNFFASVVVIGEAAF